MTATDVSKRFGDDVLAVQDATFRVEDGAFISLVGPSGCGKSTLLRLIAGLIQRTSGNLEVKGRTVTGPSEDVGMMFQAATLLPWKTAIDNALLPRKLSGDLDQTTRDEAAQLLELLGLGGFEYSYPSQLSGGMQQRVALARLLMTRARILLLDEPFGSLDEFTRERLTFELLRIHRDLGTTTLFVTHSITEAVLVADEVLVMSPHPGRIEGSVAVPAERPRHVEFMRTEQFGDLVFEVREMLEMDLDGR